MSSNRFALTFKPYNNKMQKAGAEVPATQPKSLPASDLGVGHTETETCIAIITVC